jgi:hypothetical protein
MKFEESTKKIWYVHTLKKILKKGPFSSPVRKGGRPPASLSHILL